MVFKRIVAGGGVWLLTLLLAVSTILGTATTHPNTANAADKGHSLYVTATDPDSSADALKMGLRQLGGTYETVGVLTGLTTACMVDTNGIVYVPELNLQGDIDAVTLNKVPEGAKCDPSAPNGTGIYGWYNQRSRSRFGYGAFTYYSSVDREGTLWIFPDPKLVTQPVRVPYSDLDFQQATSDRIASEIVPGGAVEKSPLYTFALADPRANIGGVTINQMPTTGAPTGLASIGLMSTGIGLAGVMLMLLRRRD